VVYDPHGREANEASEPYIENPREIALEPPQADPDPEPPPELNLKGASEILTSEQLERLKALLDEFRDVFSMKPCEPRGTKSDSDTNR